MGKGFVTPEMLHLHLIRQKGEKIFLNPEPGTRNPEPETRNPGLPGLVCKKYKIEAPELWNYDFGTGTVTKIGCFRGASLGMKKSQI